MKNKFIKLQTPCSESWENMTPNEKGRFCDSCSKNVIDLTKMSISEITTIMKQSDGSICARINQRQLDMPLLDFNNSKSYRLPYSQLAAGLMISGSILASQPATTGNINSIIQTEQNNTPSAKEEQQSTNQSREIPNQIHL